MPRTIHALVQAAIDGDNVRHVTLVELDYPSGFVQVHNGLGTFTWDSKTWLGVGELGKISPVNESEELQSQGWTVELTGIDSSKMSAVLTDDARGRSAKLWIAFLDANYDILGDPVGPVNGRIDNSEIKTGKQARILVRIESLMGNWDRPPVRRYTDADQQEEYPGDLFMEFAEQMAEVDIEW